MESRFVKRGGKSKNKREGPCSMQDSDLWIKTRD